MMGLFKKYLLIGGLPDAINCYLETTNIVAVRGIHSDIHRLYRMDAARYEQASGRKLKIQRIYDMIPSNLENIKKRVVARRIEDKTNARMADYEDEFKSLIHSVQAISKPSYPLVQNMGKNLLKLYLNDVGIFTGQLYHQDISSVMQDERSINLGAVYETLVAHDFNLFYYDNKKNGEVDFLVDDYDNMTVMPVEVKSGKDYFKHRALDRFMGITEYNVKQALVLSNDARVYREGNVTYLPIYYIMFLLKPVPGEVRF